MTKVFLLAHFQIKAPYPEQPHSDFSPWRLVFPASRLHIKGTSHFVLSAASFFAVHVFETHPCCCMSLLSILFHSECLCWMNGPSIAYLVSYGQALGMFPFGAIMNESAMDFLVQVFLWTWVFISLEEIPRSGINDS